MSLRPKFVDFDKTWNELQKTINQVLRFSPISRDTWNDSFDYIYSLCVACPEPLADRLYSKTKAFFEELSNEYQSFLKEKDNHKLLEAYSEVWNSFSVGIGYIDMLYRYLNKQYVLRERNKTADCSYAMLDSNENENMKEIRELALEIWKDNIIVPMKERLLHLIFNEIERVRLNGISCEDITLKSEFHIKNTIHSFIEVDDYNLKGIQFYDNFFAGELISTTKIHYAKESAKIMQENNISDYMKAILTKLQIESKRAIVLYPRSGKDVLDECRRQLIGNQLPILYSEAKAIIKAERFSDLQNLYCLLKPINGGLDELLNHFQSHIEDAGSKSVANHKEQTIAEEFVEHILKLRGKYLKLIVDIFQSDLAFNGALDKACNTIANRYSSAVNAEPADLLVRYCDGLLRKTSKSIPDCEVEAKLDSIITVFRYIDDKDIFQKFYAKYLGKRLIYQQSNSMELEEAVINRLRGVCGFEYTNKFHRMFTDISVSDDLDRDFNTYSLNCVQPNVCLPISFSVKVLTQGSWPINHHSGSNSLPLPIELEQSLQNYEKFYSSKFQGRKLTWIYHMSTVEMKFLYLPKVYFVSMNTQQMAILQLFHQSDDLIYQDILEATKLSEDHLTKYLQIFINCKILMSENGPLKFDSKLLLNLSYSSKKTKFKIPNIISKDPSQEVEQTCRNADDDRKMYIQATIVRVMKCRKILEHSELVREVLNQSKARFKPSITMIKKSIECLIEKAYLERDPNSHDKYSYVA